MSAMYNVESVCCNTGGFNHSEIKVGARIEDDLCRSEPFIDDPQYIRQLHEVS